MTQIKKASWSTDENSIHMGVEFSKVNKQKRLVSGWATLDNVDTEGDVVTASASADAFARARGNLREMHKKDSAVGKVVSFKEDTFRAPDGSVHRGIFVTARVSEGAQDTWLKVLDGTLSGFSIGGSIVESEEDFNKSTGEKIRKVVKYDLTELSLVDNPGNQYADVLRIQKAADGSVASITGMAAEQTILNVFYCEADEISKESPAESYPCPVCDEDMDAVGFIEDGGDRDGKVQDVVAKYLGHDSNREGGEEMAKANTEFTELIKSASVEEESTEETEAVEEDVNEVEEEETEETAADVEEVHDEDEEISKKIDELQETVTSVLAKNRTETNQELDELKKSIKEMGESFDKKASELESKLTELDTNLGKAHNRLSGLEQSLEKVNSSSALKKSVDSGESPETVQNEDPWANSAFSVHGLFKS